MQDSRPFLLPLLLGSPELVTVLHHVPQHCPTDEYQVFPPRRVLDVELKPLEPVRVALKDVLKVPEEEAGWGVWMDSVLLPKMKINTTEKGTWGGTTLESQQSVRFRSRETIMLVDKYYDTTCWLKQATM